MTTFTLHLDGKSHAWVNEYSCSGKPEEDSRSPGAGVTSSGELWGAGN